MVDSVEQLDFVERGGAGRRAARCASAWTWTPRCELLDGRVHVGARRSPRAHAGRGRRPGPRGRRAGRGSGSSASCPTRPRSPASATTRRPRRCASRRSGPCSGVSAPELRERRAAAVAAVRAVAPLEFVNGGGTGSVEATASEPAVTEVAAGSGLYGPALFDTYRHFQPAPAAFFALSVVRRPSPHIATVLGGGWTASGTPGFDRLPTPVWPRGLHLTATEGAGEAQTPLYGPGAAALRVGDRVWFRHTKAGELCEHVDELHLVDGDAVVGTVAHLPRRGPRLPLTGRPRIRC